MRRSIFTEALGYFTLLTIILSVVLYFVWREMVANVITERYTEHLHSVTLLKEQTIDQWLDQKLVSFEVFSGALKHHSLTEEDVALEQYLNTTLATDTDLVEIFLLDPETGEVLLSTDHLQEGKLKEDREYFLQGKTRPFIQNIYYSPAIESPSIVISTPLTDENTTIGVLAARVDPSKIEEVLLEDADLLETLHTYAVTGFSYLVSPTRFAEGGALRRSVYNEGVSSCLDSRSGGEGIYDGFNDRKVVGVYEWVPEREMCILAEVDYQEIAQTFRETMQRVILIIVLVNIVSILITMLAFSNLRRRFRALVSGVAKIGENDFAFRFKKQRNDEIGFLSSMFNDMASRLDALYSDLESKVTSRTLELSTAIETNRQILEKSPFAVMLLDTNGKLEFKNASLESIEKTAGISFQDTNVFNHPVFQDQAMGERLKQALKGKSFQIKKFAFQSMNKQWHYWDISAIHTLISGRNKVIVILDDITESVQSQQKLRQLDNLKSRFINALTHITRTPLSSMRWSLEALLSGDFGKLQTDQKALIRRALSSEDRILNLITSMNIVLDIEKGSLNIDPQPTSLKSFLDNILKEYTEIADLKKITIEKKYAKKTIPTLHVDKKKLRWALRAVIDNAIDYSEEESTVVIGVIILKTMIRITVKDFGQGIPDSEIDYIGDRFFRASNATNIHPDGVGLGLYIANHVVALHGGSLTLKSVEGTGTTVQIDIPLT